MTDINRVTVKIYGQEYKLRGTLEPEQIFRLAHEVDTKMQDIGSKMPHLSVQKLAVLTALRINQELHQAQEEIKSLQEEVEELKQRLESLTPRGAKRAYHKSKELRKKH